MIQLRLKNGKPFIIRKPNISDARVILEYINAISRESDFLTFGEGEFNKTVEQEEKIIENTLKQNNALFILAEVDGEIAGMLNFSGGHRLRITHTGEFGVSVLKEYWGQGIGSSLIKYLIKWCKETGIIRKINLRVRSDNSSAISVYKKLGFKEEGLITRDFLINSIFYDSIAMGLFID